MVMPDLLQVEHIRQLDPPVYCVLYVATDVPLHLDILALPLPAGHEQQVGLVGLAERVDQVVGECRAV